MALSTWSADTSAWSGNSYIWNNNTYSETATIAANSTLASTVTLTIPVSVTMTQVILSELNEEDTVFPRSISLGTNVGMTGTGLIVAPVTATFATTETFSDTGLAVMPASVTFATNGTMTDAANTVYPVSVTMTQVILSELNEEDTVFPRSLSMGMNAGMTGVVTVAVPVTATLDTELGDFKTNINFEESATLAATSGISSDNSFLWNDIAEDTGTTWTKISDPDE